jgi:hypothetical protein
MQFDEALSEIRGFWSEPRFPFNGGGQAKFAQLELEYGRDFPPQLHEYIGRILSADRFVFEQIGNSIEVYGFNDLARRLDGYNYNPITHKVIKGWKDSWFLIGDEGADPIIVDLNSEELACPVLQAMHGQGKWDFDLLASSLPQFVLLAAARHYALLMLDIDDRITDDENGFNLGQPAAEWLFPRIKKWAPEVYSAWVGVFNNA